MSSKTMSVAAQTTLAHIADVDWNILIASPTEAALDIETVSPRPGISQAVFLRVDSTADRRLGLFATQTMPKGTVILAEAPLFTTSSYPTTPKELQDLLRGLGPSQKRLYMSLYADYQGYSKTPTKAHVPLQIFRTNTFSWERESDGGVELGVFALASRFNHACQHSFLSSGPNNVFWDWDEADRKLIFTTGCRVRKGDELLIDYYLEEAQMSKMLGGSSCPQCTYE